MGGWLDGHGGSGSAEDTGWFSMDLGRKTRKGVLWEESYLCLFKIVSLSSPWVITSQIQGQRT